MNQRAAIVLSGDFEGGNHGNGTWRFGEEDLLAKVVRTAGEVVARVVVVPARRPFSEKYAAKNLKQASLAAPPSPPGSLLPALVEGMRLAGEGRDVFAVITAGLPYLSGGWLEGLFGVIAPGVDGVCATEGERRLPLLAVYSADALAAACQGEPKSTDAELALLRGRRILTHPTENAGPSGCTIANGVDSMGTYREALAHFGFCDPSHPRVTLEVFGSLRIRTGLAQLPVHAETVGGACAILRRVYPEIGRLLPPDGEMEDHFRFSVNGETVTTELDRPLKEGDHLILFSASVGG